MKVIVLSDNRLVDNNFESEHGLSVYLETEQYKFLFDTGASDVFIRNAAKAGVDLTQVDYVFISHGHRDHAGGLEQFLQLNRKVKVVLSKYALNRKYYSKRTGFREIGVELDMSRYPGRFLFVEDQPVLAENIHVLKPFVRLFPIPEANRTLFMDRRSGLVLDEFKHEIVVAIGEHELFVFTGCAHLGLLNMLESVTGKTGKFIRYVVGGFHLLDSTDTQQYENPDAIDAIVQQIRKDYPHTLFYTGHCTGDEVCRRLTREFPGQMHAFYAGMEVGLNIDSHK
ncbi:MAG: MBL fold metallo-hydrolase [Paludibacter sp.]|nr:MBL fold metallo-hydrolase [Paludibacter sp.]MDD4197825.1 MBL fold metallo-hydrolase [Paludibacter sp.]MDD4427867.1 MBL fold metallo-hydrolase [Paludibacter sp.]